MKHVSIVALALLSLAAGPVWAQSATVTGEVIASSATSLIIQDEHGQRQTFVVNEQTNLPGPLQSGTWVTVEYSGQQATRVTSSAAPAGSESSAELPGTASPLALLVLIGSASLGGVAALRLRARAHR